MSERLMLLDTAALYFRAFYGLPESLKAPDGTSVNAVRGTLDAIARLVRDYEPDQFVACWDDDWRPGWRVDLVPSYKEHRVVSAHDDGVDVEEVPEGLQPQVPIIRQLLDDLGIAVVGAADHEADDVIGTLATGADRPVDIVTSDRDLYQLVDDDAGVRVLNTGKGLSKIESVTAETVREKYGIEPGQYADFATLRGDPSDGLPGVNGIGEKTAAKLIVEYGDVDGVVAAAEDESSKLPKAQRQKILDAREYLAAAVPVVRVVRDLKLPTFDGALHAPEDDAVARVKQAGERWNLGSSVQRTLDALAGTGK